jgi:hypothetical protein
LIPKGVAPFVYTIKQYSDAAHTTLVNDYGTQTLVWLGYYIVTITDAKDVLDTFERQITEPTPIIFYNRSYTITCGALGVSIRTITINPVSGGTPNYTYHVTELMDMMHN